MNKDRYTSLIHPVLFLCVWFHFLAAEVYIMYPFLVNSRSRGMCVSRMADICILCFWSSRITPFCRSVVRMLSWLRQIIDSVPRPALFSMTVVRGLFALYSFTRGFLCLLRFRMNFSRARCHALFFLPFYLTCGRGCALWLLFMLLVFLLIVALVVIYYVLLSVGFIWCTRGWWFARFS